MNNQIAALLCGVAAWTGTAPAIGQEINQPAAVKDSGEPGAVPGSQDIIVTAQRREERAQEVPVVVTAFSAERLEKMNVKEPQDLYGNVPSLVVGSQGGATRDVQSFSIRGQSTGFLASPAVPVYLSEVPVPSAVTLNLQGGPGAYIDLENIQVLSGPQGTLFGRNTTGGAVLLVPRRPTNEFEGYLEGSIGSYKLRGLEGALNVPIIDDVLMVRASGGYQDRQGYTKDLIWNKWRDDVHWYSGRVAILFKPSDAISNTLLAYGSKSSNDGAGHIHRAFNIEALSNPALAFCQEGPSVPFAIASCDVYREQTAIADEIGPRRTRHDVDGFSKIKTWGIINTTDIALTDELRIRNIFSHQKLKTNYATDQDGTPIQQYELNQNADLPDFPVAGLTEFGLPPNLGFGNVYTNERPDFELPRDSIKQVTEELQLQGDLLDRRLAFTLGAFYYDAKPDQLWGSSGNNYCPAAFTGLCPPTVSVTGVRNRSKAVYGQATLGLGALSPALDTLKFTAGYRYTWDTIKGFTYGYRVDPANPGNVICNVNGASVPIGNAPDSYIVPAVAGSGCRFSATLKSKAPTWTVGVDYKPLDDVLIYGKVTQGYKSGGFNSFAVNTGTTTFLPEKLRTYEAGFKSDWRLGEIPARLNATYYYSDYSNIQRPAGDFNAVTQAQGAQILPATATVQGFEVDAMIRPIRQIEVGATLSHIDAEYTKFEQKVLKPQGQFTCNGFVPQGGMADYTCNAFQFVSPWVYNIHATIDIPIEESLGKLSLFVNYVHVDKQNTSPLSPPSIEPGVILEPYGLLNASATWRNVAQSGIDATVFGSNLANKRHRVSHSAVFQDLLVWSELYGAPRMYGFKLRYSFGS